MPYNKVFIITSSVDLISVLKDRWGALVCWLNKLVRRVCVYNLKEQAKCTAEAIFIFPQQGSIMLSGSLLRLFEVYKKVAIMHNEFLPGWFKCL